jgi:hypothetical protein
MKVHELVAKLARLDQNLEVYCYTEDERFATPERPFWLLDVGEVNTIEGEMSRDTDRSPVITFGQSAHSRMIATLEVTSDF